MKNRLLENILIAVFIFASLHYIIFPGLESNSWLANIVSLISFLLLVIFSLASVGFNRDQDSTEE